jgi:translation initiation factor IF-2
MDGGTLTQIRVHELAKELKISTMALKTHLNALGVITKSHMSFIDDEIADKIRLKYNEQINAEKKAEKDRKHFIEMKHQAAVKAKHDAEAALHPHVIEVVPEIEEEESDEQFSEAQQPTVEQPVTQHSVPSKKREETPPRDIRTPYQQYKPTPRPAAGQSQDRGQYRDRPQGQGSGQTSGQGQYRDRPQGQYQVQNTNSGQSRPYNNAQRPSDRPSTPGGYRDNRPAPGQQSDPRKRPDFQQRRPGGPTSTPPRKPVAGTAPAPAPKEVERERFGKSKISHEELGEKSKHRKALIKQTKKAKTVTVEPTELEEAEISRSIKRTLAGSQKKKKYHREAQQVVDRAANEIVIREYTSVSELSKIMDVAPSEIITKFFMMGQLVTMNQRLDKDSLEMICDEFSFSFRFEDEFGVEFLDKEKEQYSGVEYIHRPPVVTIMGHVDHGKTSILDYIRSANIVAGESGGITQHIGAYQIEVNKHKITFLDTPGHEAFTAMRSRGANVTDIAIIVVAATEGVKPQTVEAIDHARAAGVSMIVAINKVDLPDSNIDKTIAQILDQGVYLETYGGEVPWCKTSTVTGEGILKLIELILLTAELKELNARLEVPTEAVVIEAEKDPRMGAVVTILVREGKLKKGDIVVCGANFGRVRKMENERGVEIKELFPSDVARLYGLNDVPKAGDVLNQVDTEKTARSISSERQQIRLEREKYQNKTSLQNIFARIKEDQINELKLIIKGDTDGSVEALADSFQKLSNEEVAVNIIHKSVGGINEADVSLASASDAIIIGFHVRSNQQAKKMAEDENVEIKIYQVIYAAIDDVKKGLEGMLKPEYEDKALGTVAIRQLFKMKKLGTIAGCFVEKGVIQRNCNVRLYRNDVLIYEGKLGSLKHYQNEASEVKAGTDCGLTLDNYQDIREGDVLECYTIQQVEKKLT